MSIEVTCLQCGSSHQVNDRLAGRRVRCPECETAVHVPELDDANFQSVPIEPESTHPEAVEPEPVEPELVEPEPVDPEPVQPVPVDPIAVEPDAAEPIEALAATSAALTSDASTNDRDTTDFNLDGSTAADTLPDTVTAASLAVQGDDDEDGEVLPRSNRPEEEMDMTPMVDVTFLLLIFFMVTAAFSLQKSIQMPRQQTDAPSTAVIEEIVEELDQVEVQVDEFGSFLVLAPDWERETPGKQNLITALRDAIAGNKDGMKLIVKVHEMAKLNSLVEAMDAGTIAKFTELEVVQVEEFD